MADTPTKAAQALSSNLTEREGRELAAYLISIGQRYPALRGAPATLARVAQETATAWAHSTDKARQRVGLMALTCCENYPEDVLAVCRGISTWWVAFPGIEFRPTKRKAKPKRRGKGKGRT